jgi:tRNA(Ile)-lysidine synthase
LQSISQRDVVSVIARQAELVRDDDALLDELASALDPTDAKAIASAPQALARRALRMWLAHPYPPDLATVERVLCVARGETQPATPKNYCSFLNITHFQWCIVSR